MSLVHDSESTLREQTRNYETTGLMKYLEAGGRHSGAQVRPQASTLIVPN